MTITKAIYQGKGRVEATHMRSEVTVNTDAGKAVGGLGENQTPVELLGNALAACVLTLMGLQAERGGIDFAGCYAEVGECEEDMEAFTVTRIPITFHLKASALYMNKGGRADKARQPRQPNVLSRQLARIHEPRHRAQIFCQF